MPRNCALRRERLTLALRLQEPPGSVTVSWDPYAVLGVSRTASAEEIKSAYRRKAKALHPDLHPNDPAKAEAFKRASAAFDVLGDETKRGRFDRGEIDADGNERMRNPFGGAGPSAGQGTGGFQGDPFEDLLSGLFGGRGGRRGPGPGPMRGRDIRYRVDVEFADAVTGASRRFTMSDGRSFDVQIPAGIETGQTLRLRSQGEPGPGGVPGDALLEIRVLEDRRFRREGNDLHMSLPVTLKQAVEGGKVEIETPTGRVTLKVPDGSNTGSVLRLKGRGVQVRPTPGHLYVRLEIVLKDPSDGALRQFVKSQGAN